MDVAAEVVGVVDPASAGLLDMRAYGLGVLAALSGAAVLIFDVDLRVSFADGDEFPRIGVDLDSIEGRILPDVLPASSWAELKRPYEGALKGASSAFDFTLQENVYAIRVSPLRVDGAVVGALSVSRSVNEERRLESRIESQNVDLRVSERLLAAAFDHAPTGMSLLDLEGNWLRVNDAYCRMLGYERADLLDKSFRDITHPDDIAEDSAWLLRARAGETSTLEYDKRYIAGDGSTVWVHARAEVINDDGGKPAYTVTQLVDVTERRAADLALRASERRLSSILDNSPDAVSVQGRDHRYQLVNDAFERRLGMKREAIVGRLDKEILPAGIAEADRSINARVLETGDLVEQEEVDFLDGVERIYLTTKFPLRGDDGEIEAVCGIFNDITDRKRREHALRDRLAWTDRIHTAVAQDRLILHAQPIIDLDTGEVEQAELLVRMLGEHGAPGLIPPGEFLPAAERFGLIGVIDHWVVTEAIKLAADHRVEVNLSGQTVSDPVLVDEIERMVVESGVPPANIVFEITETAVAENLGSARLFAEQLREIGCSFALDDFGVGFGTFTYLKHLPVDYLKIDIDFVRELTGDEANRQVVQAIVGVAGDFGMKTIAEGVEDEATLNLLGLMGVDYAQGYWIERPIPIAELWPDTSNRLRRKR